MRGVKRLVAGLALFWTVLWWWCVWRLARVQAGVGSLRSHPPAERCPSLSVIFAARNEADTLVAAVRSLLALDYPELTVIAVDDRSEDATGRLLHELAQTDPRLRVVRVDHLSPDWLGKTHALWQGARVAPGELLLFTDADVHFAPDSLRRAVSALEGYDHLVLGPKMICCGFWENLFVSFFGGAFCVRYRPDLAQTPDQRFAMGIGAFNLVRTAAYWRCGAHPALRLQVLDDMGLGVLLKTRGFRQRYLDSAALVQVRWIHGGLRGAVLGLEKNAYAGLDYNPLLALGAVLTIASAGLAPVVLALAGQGPAALAIMAAMLAISRMVSAGMGPWPWCGLGYPLVALLFSFVLARSGWLAERRQGIRWRGTFYPLRLLRRHTLEAL